MASTWQKVYEFVSETKIVDVALDVVADHLVLTRHAKVSTGEDLEQWDNPDRLLEVIERSSGGLVYSRRTGEARPEVSPDGRWIVHDDPRGTIQVRDISTAKIRGEWKVLGGRRQLPVLWVEDESGWSIRVRDQLAEWSGKGSTVRASRSGDSIVMTPLEPDGGLVLIDSKTRRAIFRSPMILEMAEWSRDEKMVALSGRFADRGNVRSSYLVVATDSGRIVYEYDSMWPDGFENGVDRGRGLFWSRENSMLGSFERTCVEDLSVELGPGQYVRPEIDSERVIIHRLSTLSETSIIDNSMFAMWSPDDSQILTCHSEEHLHVNRIRSLKNVNDELVFTGRGFEVWNDDYTRLIIEDPAGDALEVWDPWSRCMLAQIPRSKDAVSLEWTKVGWSANGCFVVVITEPTKVEVWGEG